MPSPQYHSRTQKFSYRFANGIITSRSEKKNLSKNQRLFKLTLGISHSNKLVFSPWKLQAFSKLDNLFLEGSITELWKSILTSVPLTHIFYKNKVNYTYASEKAMAPHFNTLAWRIPGTGEPGGLPSMGSHRVGHDWSHLVAAAAAYLCVLSQILTFSTHVRKTYHWEPRGRF